MIDNPIKSAARAKPPAFEQQPLPFPIQAAPPLDGAEVAGIVRSVYKRHQRQLSSGEQQQTFSLSPVV